MSRSPHLSVTQLKMYLRCPLQYFFRYVCGLKIPPTGGMALGRSIHSTLQENYRQKMANHQDLPVSEILDRFSEHWKLESEGTVFSDGEVPGRLKDDGAGLLRTYFDKVAPGVQPVDVERGFLIETGPTEKPIKGYIDLIDDRGMIIDHKTAKRAYPANSAEADVQLTAYAMAYRCLYGQSERGVRLDVMVRSKTPRVQQLESTRSGEDIGRFLRLAQSIEGGIRDDIYYPNEGYACSWCGYTDMCKQW